jgi:hypothetical protein
MPLDREQVIERLEGTDGSRDLSGLDLSGADLSRLDLRDVNLSRADLSAADLRWAVLEGADLDAAVLRRADARWAVLRGANLRQADLVRTNLGWADLNGADLTGADLDGTNLENADIAGTLLERGGGRRGTAAAGAASRGLAMPSSVGGVSLPEVSALTVVLAALGVAAVIFVWGWLFQRSYYLDAFSLHAPGVAELGEPRNLLVGLTGVLWLEVKALLAVPLVFLALVLVAALVALIPVIFAFVSERILTDIVRPEARPFVIGGLFVAMTIFFLFAIPRALAFAGSNTANATPNDPGLSAIFQLFQIGGWLTRLGLIASLAVAIYMLWIFWRLFSYWLSGYDLPLNVRLRYPHLNSAFVALRESRLLSQSHPLTADERKYALIGAAVLVLLLGTILTGTGRVFAYRDMCDGGDLKRVQLYYNEVPPDVDDRVLCERMLAVNDESYFVFFPSQTQEEVAGDISTRAANVQSVTKSDSVLLYEAVGPDDCPTCESSTEAKLQSSTRFIIDPEEIEVQGYITDRTADLVTLDTGPETISSVRLLSTTSYRYPTGDPATDSDVQVGTYIRAVGRLAVDAPILEARLVEILPETEAGEQPTMNVTMQDPYTIVVSGEGWIGGNQVAIGLGHPGDAGPTVPLVLEPVTVSADGTFSVPVLFRSDLPTGAEWQVMARDSKTGQLAVGPWLMEPPPPTATPVPSPTPIRIVESSPTPIGAEDATAQTTWTPAPGATNTPLPTPNLSGAGPVYGDCTPDEYEPDWPRGFEKEIYVGFGESASTAQQHNFCGRGPRIRSDVDLAYFQAKAGRWYRVSTSGLAPGVDTVMAVGDLGDDTPCQPAGCWNDDRAALTYESEIVFQAVRDAKAMITVDNRGTAYGTDASYTLTVVEFEPVPTVTPTVSPTPSATRTPTITPTPLPLKDPYEVGNRCRESEIWNWLEPNRWYNATIYGKTDVDYFRTVTLVPGMQYYFELYPPAGQDYDMDLWIAESKSTCSLFTGLEGGLNPGEGEPERIPPFDSFSVAEDTEFVVRVYSPYPNVYYDPHHYYRLRLVALGTPAPSLTPTPAETDTPTPTPTPTFTPTIPIPESGTNPPSPTSTAAPPTATSTPTPSETPTAAPSATLAPPAPPPEGRGR